MTDGPVFPAALKAEKMGTVIDGGYSPDSCMRCFHWNLIDSEPPLLFGQCRRYAPGKNGVDFPLTHRDVLCGDYRPLFGNSPVVRED